MKNVFVRAGSPLLLVAATLLFAVVPAHAQSGGALFKAKCAPCHGPDGKGDTSMGKMLKVRDLSSAGVQKQTNAELTAVIEDGKGKMPAYKGKLSGGEIKELVSFIRSLKQ
ncbi:MAG TPA: cytochrome c [Candidatus Acidoferrales bacterium]|nr:cytochrome c [Candidatus Acidoferrales bacterium]